MDGTWVDESGTQPQPHPQPLGASHTGGSCSGGCGGGHSFAEQLGGEPLLLPAPPIPQPEGGASQAQFSAIVFFLVLRLVILRF